MKIDRAPPAAVEPLNKRAEAPRRAEPATKVTTGEQARMRSLSDEVQDVSAREREQRLLDVKAAVSQGAYRPDPSRIADQILREAEMSVRLRSMLR